MRWSVMLSAETLSTTPVIIGKLNTPNLKNAIRAVGFTNITEIPFETRTSIGRSAGASLIISRFRSPFSDRSYIGVLGPTRQQYRDVMMLVRRAGQELEEVLYA